MGAVEALLAAMGLPVGAGSVLLAVQAVTPAAVSTISAAVNRQFISPPGW
jgi:hypothetical protein